MMRQSIASSLSHHCVITIVSSCHYCAIAPYSSNCRVIASSSSPLLCHHTIVIELSRHCIIVMALSHHRTFNSNVDAAMMLQRTTWPYPLQKKQHYCLITVIPLKNHLIMDCHYHDIIIPGFSSLITGEKYAYMCGVKYKIYFSKILYS